MQTDALQKKPWRVSGNSNKTQNEPERTSNMAYGVRDLCSQAFTSWDLERRWGRERVLSKSTDDHDKVTLESVTREHLDGIQEKAVTVMICWQIFFANIIIGLMPGRCVVSIDLRRWLPLSAHTCMHAYSPPIQGAPLWTLLVSLITSRWFAIPSIQPHLAMYALILVNCSFLNLR
jgi:hypothetical protein